MCGEGVGALFQKQLELDVSGLITSIKLLTKYVRRLVYKNHTTVDYEL